MTSEQKRFMDVSALYLSSTAPDVASTTSENRSRRLADYLNSLLEHDVEPGIVAVLAWKRDMADRGMKPSSIQQYLRELHAFYAWAIDNDYYAENPVKKSDMPSVKQNPYRLMSERDMMRLLAVEKPKNAKDTYWERNRTIVIVLINTALRNAELRALTPGDLDWENEEIFVRSGKGGKDRYVPFPHLARVAVRQYLDSGFRPPEAGDDTPLFGRVEQGRWKGITSRSALTVMVQRYAAMVVPEYDKKVGSHALRHMGASLLVTNGDSMENIQAALGHASQQTTKIYAARLRPARQHVKSGNKVWEEIEYQTRHGEAALARRNGGST